MEIISEDFRQIEPYLFKKRKIIIQPPTLWKVNFIFGMHWHKKTRSKKKIWAKLKRRCAINIGKV